MEKHIHTILLAEDNDEHYINFVQAVNNISGSIEVMRVNNGYDLLSMLETNIKPDVIFLDIDMPYKSGLQILEDIQEKIKTQKLPVIILSASAFDLMIKVAHQLGAILFAKKYHRPGDLQQLLATVFSNPYFISCTQAPFEEFVIE